MQKTTPVITVDGTSGVGKGTLAKRLAKELGFHYLDSGVIYRVIAWLAIQNQIDSEDVASLVKAAMVMDLQFQDSAILVNGIDVTNDIRREECSQMASKTSKHADVRATVLELQQSFAKAPGLVTDGRDMGTVVFPDASVKLFLTASPEVRAQRRFSQLQGSCDHASLAQILQDLIERDSRDQSRVIAPLKPAADAIVIDTSELAIDAVLSESLRIIRNVLK